MVLRVRVSTITNPKMNSMISIPDADVCRNYRQSTFVVNMKNNKKQRDENCHTPLSHTSMRCLLGLPGSGVSLYNSENCLTVIGKGHLFRI